MSSRPPDESLPPDDDEDLLGQAFFRERNVADLAAAAQRHDVGPSIARRILPRAALALALLVVVDVVLRSAVPPESLLMWMDPEPAAYVVKVERFAERPAPDVLVLGSSRVRDGVVPDEVEAVLARRGLPDVDVYAMGLVNAKLAEWRAFVRGHLPDPAPERVVIGVTGSELIRVHGFQYAARFLWRLADLRDYVARTSYADFEVEHVESFLASSIGEWWYLFEYREPLRERLVAWALGVVGLDEYAPRSSPRLQEQSAWIRDFVLADDGYAAPLEASPLTLAAKLRRDERSVQRTILQRELVRDPEMREGSFDVLVELVADLERRGCRVALVEMPVSPYLQSLNPVLHGDVFRRRLALLCDELDVTWVAMPPERSHLTDAMYSDVNHLTDGGARRYSKALARELLAAGFFDEAGR